MKQEAEQKNGPVSGPDARLCGNAGQAADTSSGKHRERKETSGKRIMCTKIVRPAVAAKSGPNAHARGNPKPDRRTPAGKTKSQGTLLAMREIAEHVNQSDLETLGR
jgi:hypothetical protein